MEYRNLSTDMKSNSLIWENVYNKLNPELQIRYVNLMSKRYDIKYALRTINILIDKNTLQETIKYYKKDLDNGSWTIDIVDNSGNVDDYFNENNLEEFYSDLISFCEEWE
jgi:hypothetical protein